MPFSCTAIVANSKSMVAASTHPAKLPFFDHFWPFVCNYMNIFQKAEVLTVILRCWTGLDLNWFKSYDTKCKYIFLDLATLEIINGRFLTISKQFSAISVHKYLSQNWGSDGHFEILNRSQFWLVQKLGHKTQIFPFLFFALLYKNTHLLFLSFCIFCHNFCTNI